MSDAYTINGQPGDLYKCSSKGLILSSFSIKPNIYITLILLLNRFTIYLVIKHRYYSEKKEENKKQKTQ